MKKYYDDMFKEYSKDCKKNFASINSVLGRRRNLAKKFSDYLTEKTDENFVFENMTPDIINDALSKLKNKNSSGPDNISTNLLKSIMPSIMGLYICHFLICRLKLVIFQPSLKLVKSFQSSRLENLIHLQITDQLVYFNLFQNFQKK